MAEGTGGKARKILFTSGKGGVGKSTLASAFAKILSARGERVLLIDFDISLRTLDIMLGLGDLVLYDWNDVLQDRCDPDDAIVTNGSGPELLPAPLSARLVTPAQIRNLVKRYEAAYDTIILDSPAGVGRGFHAAMTPADFALVVSTPDKVSVRSAAVAAEKLAKRGVPARVLINRFSKKDLGEAGRLNIDDVIDSTGLQLQGVIPEDPSLADAALSGGPVDLRRRGAKAIDRVLRRLDGERVPLKL